MIRLRSSSTLPGMCKKSSVIVYQRCFATKENIKAGKAAFPLGNHKPGHYVDVFPAAQEMVFSLQLH